MISKQRALWCFDVFVCLLACLPFSSVTAWGLTGLRLLHEERHSAMRLSDILCARFDAQMAATH